MLTIRMRRLGAKKRPFFRVVVTEARSARDGRSLEVLGYYDPATQPETFRLNRDRFQHWVTRGAQPSDTVRTLLARHPEGAEEAAAAAAPVTEPVATREAPEVPEAVVPAEAATEESEPEKAEPTKVDPEKESPRS